jgi:hypothetical protein
VIYRKSLHTDRYVLAASHHPAACKRSITLQQRSATKLLNYGMSSLFSEPTVAPYRTSTGDPAPAPPIETRRENT